MPITRHHSGRWLYQLRRTVAGKRIRVNKLLPQGWTRAEAERFDDKETARQVALASGVRQQEPLIEDAVALYLTEHAPHLKNKGDIEGAFVILYPWIEGRTFADLPDVARAVRAEMDAKPATVRNRLSYLRSACRWAWKNHKMGEHDPGERMLLPNVKNAREVYLTRAEMLRIARNMGYGSARDVVRIAFYTGMRLGEILRSTREKKGDDWILSVADTKNGLPRKVWVHDAIKHLVRGPMRKLDKREVIWPPVITSWGASKAFKRSARRVGLGHARLHDLRHSAASEMINAGVDLYRVGKVLGHKSQVSTARYAHLAIEAQADAIGRIGRKMQPKPQARAA